ncbi:MAG: hypothetical protein RI973_1347 [Bacteroidota bacterium]
MQAIIRTKAGKNFSTMQVAEIPPPSIRHDELRVKMVSSRINPVDMDLMSGMPFLKYKQPQVGGIDGAGIVTASGDSVAGFQPGDKVFFYRKFSDIGTWAEEIAVKAADCARVPDSIDLAEAGAISLPLLTAYDSLKQMAAGPGDKLLIHGAGGGVGFMALLVAKQMGLQVVGTAGERDAAALERAGIDRLIDYKSQDFEALLKRKEVDYVLDTQGSDVLLKSIRLQPRRIVSLKYIDPGNMQKAGVELPGAIKWVMKLTMKKYDRLAKLNMVEIIGQVTGADGRLLQEAADFIGSSYVSRGYSGLSLGNIARNGGLSPQDIGKVIVF